MEALIKKLPNTQGNYSLQYFDLDFKMKVVSFKTLEDGICFINDLSGSKAEIKFEGNIMLVYQWETTLKEHNENVKLAYSHLK